MCKCIACVASISVRSRSKEWGTRVKDCAKNGASKRAGRGWRRVVPCPLFHFLTLILFFTRPKPKIRFLVVPWSFFCSEPTRKHLLHRLASVFTSVLIQSVNSDKNNGHKRPLKLPVFFKTLFDKLLQKCPSLQSGAPEFKPRSSNSLSWTYSKE